MIAIELVKIAVRSLTFNKQLGIYENGENNDYPERTERFRNLSVTATMASGKMTSFVVGRGMGEIIDKLKIGRFHLINHAEDISRNIVDERGVFIKVNFNAVLELSGEVQIDNFEVIPYKNLRKGKEDDRKYTGKILFYDGWTTGNVNKDKIRAYDAFNPNASVIKAQVKKAGGWANYPGQVFFYSMDRQLRYPLSRIHTVVMECDNEHLSSVYTNRILRFGFFGKTIVVTRPLIDWKKEGDVSAAGKKIWARIVSEAENFKKVVKEFLGAENVGGAIILETEFAGEDIKNAIHIEQVKSDIDPDLFKNLTDTASDKILMAYNAMPGALIRSNDNSLFGQSGESLLEMKRSYQENVEKEISAVELILNELLQYVPAFKAISKDPVKIIPLIAPRPTTEPVVPVTEEQPK